jgi:uncharacterized protein (DUF983 family)
VKTHQGEVHAKRGVKAVGVRMQDKTHNTGIFHVLRYSAAMPVSYDDAPIARDTALAIKRGALGQCPSCGEGRIFGGYLKVNPSCQSCSEELYHQRADDAPPYIVISIVGHIVIGLLLWVEMAYRPELWVHAVLWVPLTLILCLGLLPPVKGALVGMQWALRMHGFGGENDPTRDPA